VIDLPEGFRGMNLIGFERRETDANHFVGVVSDYEMMRRVSDGISNVLDAAIVNQKQNENVSRLMNKVIYDEDRNRRDYIERVLERKKIDKATEAASVGAMCEV
jgi:acyl-[acyl carrier protein]--UDP-N-acetylglucosamine O-acyltransferase